MQLFIIYNKSHLINNINQNSNVLDLKKIITQQFNIPIQEQSLQFCGKILNDNLTLSHYNISNNSSIFLNKNLEGGTRNGFPDIGHMIILLGVSTIILLGIYSFYSKMVWTIRYFDSDYTKCETPPIKYIFNEDSCYSLAAPGLTSQTPDTQKIKKGGNNPFSSISIDIIFRIIILIYSSLITIILTIYLYTTFCHSQLSHKVVISSLASLLISFIFLVAFYWITRKGRLPKYKNLIYEIVSGLFGIFSFILFSMMIYNGVPKWMYLYPFGVTIAMMILYYFVELEINKFIKLFGVLFISSIFIFAPFILAFVYSSIELCG